MSIFNLNSLREAIEKRAGEENCIINLIDFDIFDSEICMSGQIGGGVGL